MQNLVPPGGSEGESVPYLSPEKSPLHCTAILGPEAASSLKGHIHKVLQTGVHQFPPNIAHSPASYLSK